MDSNFKRRRAARAWRGQWRGAWLQFAPRACKGGSGRMGLRHCIWAYGKLPRGVQPERSASDDGLRLPEERERGIGAWRSTSLMGLPPLPSPFPPPSESWLSDPKRSHRLPIGGMSVSVGWWGGEGERLVSCVCPMAVAHGSGRRVARRALRCVGTVQWRGERRSRDGNVMA